LRAVLAFSLLFLYSQISTGQEVLPLSNIKDLEALKESNKGKVVLVNFWATWCVPCVKEFPEIVQLYKDYKKKNFKVIFISVDFPDEIDSKVKPFLKKKNVDFVSYYSNFDDVSELINSFDTKWGGDIPATYIFSRTGKLTSVLQGKKEYSEFEEAIEKALD
jgi:thiol-disulfide isomerase/thioredoxin